MEENQSIDQLMELLEAIKLLATTGVKVAYSFSTATVISELITLGMNFEGIKKAFTDLDKIPSEMADLTEEEVVSIVSKIFEIINAIKAVIPAKS